METIRGRPPKADNERAEQVFQVRLTQAEKAAWRAAADRMGMTLSAWIKERLNKAAKRDTL